MARKRLRWLHRAISSILLCSIGYMPVVIHAQSDGEAEVRTLIEEYFAAYERKDLNGLMALWSEKSPELASGRQSFQQTFATHTTVEMKRVAVRNITLTGDKALARVVIEINALDAKAGKRAKELVKKYRTLHLVNEANVWRVWRDVSSEEELAAAISAAKTDEERKVLLEADKELVTVELRKALTTQGIQFTNRGNHTDALRIFQLALIIAQDLDDKTGIAVNLRGFGYVHASQGNYTQAVEYLQRSLAIAEEIGDKVGIIRSLNLIGSIRQSQGDYIQALENYQKSLTMAQESGDKTGAASALLNIGVIHQLQGNYTYAHDNYQRSLTISQELKDRALIARGLSGMGAIHQMQGNYARAIEYYQKSLTISADLGDSFGSAATLRNIALVHEWQGSYAQALEHFEKSLAISMEMGDRSETARTLCYAGGIQRLQGNYIRALENCQKGLTISVELGDKAGAARTLHNVGNIHWSQGNYAQALEYYKQSLAISVELNDKLGIARTLNSIGTVHQFQGNYTQALENYRKSLTIAEEIGNRPETESAINHIGGIHQLQGNYTDALEHYQKSLRISQEIGDKAAVSRDLNNIGTIYGLQGNYTEAIELANQAALMAQQIGALETLWGARTTGGQAYQLLNNFEQAQRAFADAIASIEQLRDQVVGGEQQRELFFEGRLSPYHAMIDLLISHNYPAQALAFAERAKARALLDVFQSGQTIITKAMTVEERERERVLNSELVSLNTQIYREKLRDQPDQFRLNDLTTHLKSTRLQLEAFHINLYAAHPELKIHRGNIGPMTIGELTSLIPNSSTALLQYVVTESKTHLFVVTRSKTSRERVDLKLFTLNVKQKELTDRVEQFRTRLANRDFTADELGTELYSLLLKPANTELKGKTSLIVVPDGVLWDLSFQALQPRKNRYLIEDASLSYAPSFTALREILKAKKKPANSSRAGAVLLAFGNPAIGNETVQREKSVFLDEKLEPLPEAERQVKMLAQIYGSDHSKIYVLGDATEERIKAEAGNYRILHLATHAILNDASPMYSHVLLSQPGVRSKEDGLLEAWELMNLNIDADVVVLSACETARGRVGAGEGMIGLTWALFIAGSPAAVASQWKVEVQSTTELMVEFHRNLKLAIENPKSKMTKAQALRQAALKLLRSKQYRHPFYWAGFVIVGNGR